MKAKCYMYTTIDFKGKITLEQSAAINSAENTLLRDLCFKVA